MELSAIIAIVGALVVPALGYLLNKKDASQEKEIDELKKTVAVLFKKHDEDAAALVLLQRQIDKEHYIKPELDARFQSLETTFREGFTGLRAEFKELATILIAHITKDDKK